MNRILIAEDESRIAALMEKGLRKSGFITTVAEDGTQAVFMAQSGNYDLLLLDLGLPGKDGWAGLEELRCQGKHLPTIIVTARDEVVNNIVELKGGPIDYVTKPFQFKDLLERVRTLL